MEKALEKSLKRIEELELLVLNAEHALKEVLGHQVSMDSHFQKLMKSYQIQKVAIVGATKIDFVGVNEIVYCRANAAYTEIICKDNNIVVASKCLNDFEKQLLSPSFCRISKSLLINIDYVDSFNKKNSQVLMKNNDSLEVSRRRKTDFVAAILGE